MAIESYRQLNVWNKAMILANQIYDVTAGFPKEEIYGLSSQMRRAAVSVASNIAEGSRRGTRAEFRRFCEIAHGSLAELETQCILAFQRQYIAETIYTEIMCTAESISRMLVKLKNSLKTSSP